MQRSEAVLYITSVLKLSKKTAHQKIDKAVERHDKWVAVIGTVKIKAVRNKNAQPGGSEVVWDFTFIGD